MNAPADVLVPPPPVVRQQLASNLEEARLLRRLLRLSVQFAERRHRPRPDVGAAPGAEPVACAASK